MDARGRTIRQFSYIRQWCRSMKYSCGFGCCKLTHLRLTLKRLIRLPRCCRNSFDLPNSENSLGSQLHSSIWTERMLADWIQWIAIHRVTISSSYWISLRSFTSEFILRLHRPRDRWTVSFDLIYTAYLLESMDTDQRSRNSSRHQWQKTDP